MREQQEILRAQNGRTVLWTEIPDHLRFDPGRGCDYSTCQAVGPMSKQGFFQRCLIPTKKGATFCHLHGRQRIVHNVSDPEEISAQWEAVMKVAL